MSGKQLQSIVEIKSASHKILAWRKESSQRSLTGSVPQYDVGHDDDGEKYAGKKVEKVLEQMQVVGACVVARWYGGVMLGPVRFTHIETCAKEAVRKWQEHLAEEQRKKRRVEAEAMEKETLMVTLTERDQSIDVLRKMAVEKEKRVKDALVAGMEALQGKLNGEAMDESNSAQHANPKILNVLSPIKTALDYGALPVERLRVMEKARDATLNFLLKRIEKAEKDLLALETEAEPEKPP
ncbi:hypothetical protein BAUCODRAFT_125053 [Baudoinia panamericana UAMH 10762]|uniref:Impact N-terminal domain-containing protein n=1 Tax=Baudoinia panamericana (strain UAMH 10762) TaxID=717646 RepID=M2MNY3_BAUPA|nr:uncharacterized protein BAUCODRAFT_125053 [Baudoinia panamericana UAMH 10762]EMC93168.1 hypothetical protein BAUCODRAFT_125053 [Baudoinia panamericana UAMH 10762]